MKKSLNWLLALVLIVSNFLFLTGAAVNAQDVPSRTVSAEPSSAGVTLNSGNSAFGLNLSVNARGDAFDLRLIVVENLSKVNHTADLNVRIAFEGAAGEKHIDRTLKAGGGGTLTRYTSVSAGGKQYKAAAGHALFGCRINGIPYGGFTGVEVTVSQKGKTLYTGRQSYGTIFAADPDFKPSGVENLSRRWMSYLDDSAKISEVTIPGSHDSGATHGFFGSSAGKTQNVGIADELNMGVRGFDIRCKVRNGGFAVYHGIVDQKLTFDQVIADCKAFLSEHPSEFLMMFIKEELILGETPNPNFESIARSYLKKDSDLWYTSNSIPTVGEVRGKIVLLRRFGASGTLGIKLDSGWADNREFTVNNGVECRVQDFYNLGNNTEENLNKKWNLIEQYLNSAKSAPASALTVNFTSGYTTVLDIIPNITSVSDFVNPKLKDWFGSAKRGKYGLLLSDFVDEDLTRLIFMTNFNG